MSVITAFFGSFGSSSPYALPEILSYGTAPAPAPARPPEAGDSTFRISIRVTCASVTTTEETTAMAMAPTSVLLTM
jgi:hypothetical protein